MVYKIYKVRYSTHSQSPCYAVVSSCSKEGIEGLLKNEIGEESFDKLYDTKDTGYKADKEGIIMIN